jgi:hypothetical protein
MSIIDKLAVRFTAFLMAFVFLVFAVHFARAQNEAVGSYTLEKHKADDKAILWK